MSNLRQPQANFGEASWIFWGQFWVNFEAKSAHTYRKVLFNSNINQFFSASSNVLTCHFSSVQMYILTSMCLPAESTTVQVLSNMQADKLKDFHLQKFTLESWVLTHRLKVILFEIDCAIFYTNLHELFCQFCQLNKVGKFW